MKTFRVYAKEICRYYVDIPADSEEEAYEKSIEIETSEWIEDEERNYMNDTWETYDCEEI